MCHQGGTLSHYFALCNMNLSMLESCHSVHLCAQLCKMDVVIPNSLLCPDCACPRVCVRVRRVPEPAVEILQFIVQVPFPHPQQHVSQTPGKYHTTHTLGIFPPTRPPPRGCRRYLRPQPWLQTRHQSARSPETVPRTRAPSPRHLPC